MQDPSRDIKKIALPAGLALVEEGTALKVTRRWLERDFFVLAGFSLVWVGFFVLWYTFAAEYRSGEGLVAWFFFVFPVGHVLFTVWLVYYALAGILNHTTLTVTPQHLEVKHTPIPWPGSRSLPGNCIEELYFRRLEHRIRGTIGYSYELHAVCNQQRHTRLMGHLETMEQAQFLAHEIETRLAKGPLCRGLHEE